MLAYFSSLPATYNQISSRTSKPKYPPKPQFLPWTCLKCVILQSRMQTPEETSYSEACPWLEARSPEYVTTFYVFFSFYVYEQGTEQHIVEYIGNDCQWHRTTRFGSTTAVYYSLLGIYVYSINEMENFGTGFFYKGNKNIFGI